MKSFLNKDFLLNNQTARTLYHECAAGLPIIDYHCHVSPKEIFQDLHFENITQVWLYGDHYKWRIMRSNGVDEKYITGDATDKEKFFAFASALPKAIGNPMYHWCHLELQRYFGYCGTLSEDTAKEVWNLTSEKLKDPNMGVRGLIKQSNVAFVGTTDDPIDSLEWHVKIKEDPTIDTVVAPSFRPDKALNIEKPDWLAYVAKLADVCGFEIDGLESMKRAIDSRIQYFHQCGCKASDHGLDYVFYREASDEDVDAILKIALRGQAVNLEQAEKVKTALLLHCARKYAELGWVMQLHFNCMRNPNSLAFEKLGPDSGFDCIGPNNSSRAVAKILDNLYKTNSLPKTILYSLDAGDNAFLDTLIGAFQGTEVAGKIQHGSAWWFNDNKQGMRDQLVSLANLSLLGNFVGMLTDSRSFLSYTRHEYFRRILCGLVGEWVENGEYPNDEKQLHKIVGGICYYNALKYFGLNKED